jgi:hypothetical protein
MAEACDFTVFVQKIGVSRGTGTSTLSIISRIAITFTVGKSTEKSNLNVV